MAVIPIFDLDGTLLDSDEALEAPFLALGVVRDQITFGHVVTEECLRLGIDVDEYLSNYDCNLAQPFAGVVSLISSLKRWAVCSNKHGPIGRAELRRLGWLPDGAFFADSFDGPKHLGPVVNYLDLGANDTVVFVGDTEHDRRCASDFGVPFLVAAWNPRASHLAGDERFDSPAALGSYLDRGGEGVGVTPN